MQTIPLDPIRTPVIEVGLLWLIRGELHTGTQQLSVGGYGVGVQAGRFDDIIPVGLNSGSQALAATLIF